MKINKYLRNDGQEFHADEGSPSDQLMSKAGEFELMVEENETETDSLQSGTESESDSEETLETETHDESETDPQQPALENSGATGDAGQSSPKKRGGTGSKNKGKDSEVSSSGESLSKDGD